MVVRHRLVRFVLIALALGLVPAAAWGNPAGRPGTVPARPGDDYPAPAAWAGIWTEQVAVFDCDTGQELLNTSYTDTICAGDPMEIGQGSNVVCSGAVTDDEVELDCEWSSEVYEGCMARFTVSVRATRTGDRYTSVSTLNVHYEGEACEFLNDTCTREESTGTRIAPPPPSCGTPAETSSWGRVKALYR